MSEFDSFERAVRKKQRECNPNYIERKRELRWRRLGW